MKNINRLIHNTRCAPVDYLNQKVSVYFDYLDRVIALCEKRNIRFETVDRLLYIFDKRKNGKL